MSRRYWFPKHYADVVQRLRVPAGFALLATFLLTAGPSPLTFALGAPVSALGLLLRSWAAGHLAKNESLATSGPYALTRNPLYLGTLITALGLCLAGASPWLALLLLAIFVLVYYPVMELEEQHLRNLFPDYAAYADSVPLLFPLRAPRGPLGGFHWRQWRRNQEYKALLGFLAALLYLLWLLGWGIR
ncbi:MAG: isoprenylcysteine carboxylmethyltransferase family protein [Bryobacterales bacterium]|nr:isoprenylcysteine carboxylmethyltransferase family protein [Bryobacterales bacterium]